MELNLSFELLNHLILLQLRLYNFLQSHYEPSVSMPPQINLAKLSLSQLPGNLEPIYQVFVFFLHTRALAAYIVAPRFENRFLHRRFFKME